MTDDDRMPASFVWTDDDELQKEPEGPALGNYPGYLPQWDRRQPVGEKLARFLNDLAEKVRGIH